MAHIAQNYLTLQVPTGYRSVEHGLGAHDPLRPLASQLRWRARLSAVLLASVAVITLRAVPAAAQPAATQPAAAVDAPAATPPPAMPQAAPNWIDDVSFFGARTIAEDAAALYATAGLPDVEIGAVYGLSTLADVTPRVRFQYGRGARIGGGGVSLSSAFRMKFAEWQGWTFAVLGTPEVALHLYGVNNPATTKSSPQTFRVTPFAGSLVADRLVLPSLRLILGLEAAVGFFVSPEVVLHTPLAVQLGAELRITERLFLLTRFDTGFDYYSQGSRPGSEIYLRARVGIGWAR